MDGLVSEAEKALGKLVEGQKYTLAVASVLGGEYEVANVKTASYSEIINAAGVLGEKIKDLPDGAEIELAE